MTLFDVPSMLLLMGKLWVLEFLWMQPEHACRSLAVRIV